jgi:hypothetical protein
LVRSANLFAAERAKEILVDWPTYKLTELYCVVYQTLKSRPPIEVKVACA